MFLRVTFFKACRLHMFFIKYYNGNRFMLHEKTKSIETKTKSEVIFSKKNFVTERFFVLPIKSLNQFTTTIYIHCNP